MAYTVVTAIIYYYVMTDFLYAKRDSGYGGVMYIGKNVNKHFSSNFDIFVTKITDLNTNTSICSMLKGESCVSRNETRSLCNSR